MQKGFTIISQSAQNSHFFLVLTSYGIATTEIIISYEIAHMQKYNNTLTTTLLLQDRDIT